MSIEIFAQKITKIRILSRCKEMHLRKRYIIEK